MIVNMHEAKTSNSQFGLKPHHSGMNFRMYPKIKGKESLTQRRKGAT